ncbi:MAG: glycine cleavage system protein GcvH [Candidatus Limiplasma sp.]|nr:glycine cleavage system protein GcvH [Candidatus Limiplasma sp.]MEA5145705.1 glycine cleavage system protein GcvH [Candidatus Limiplasma sp.]
MEIKTDRVYSASHEWVLFETETTATIGVTDFAQSELGDLVFVNLPQVGDAVTAGQPFADVESVKAVSDVYCPVSGTVSAINEALLSTPQMINENAYDAWFIKVENITDKSPLMDADAYRTLTGE